MGQAEARSVGADTAATTADETEPEVGSRVEITAADGTTYRGLVVDDFGDLAGTEVVIDTDRTAMSRRWAVLTDDGSMVFVDDVRAVDAEAAVPPVDDGHPDDDADGVADGPAQS